MWIAQARAPLPLGQIGGPEGSGEQRFERNRNLFTARAAGNYLGAGPKLIDHLPAGAAGGGGGFSGRINNHAGDTFFAGGNGAKDSGAFGAVGESVGSVFYIATGIDLPGICEHRCADVEFGIGRVREPARGLRGGLEFCELGGGGH